MKALFAGSFHPFTIGHKDVVDRALRLFDEIIIGIGQNIYKPEAHPVEEILSSIKRIYADNPKVSVMAYRGLTADFAVENGVNVMIRAVRGIKDFEYERDIAQTNLQLCGIETVILFTKPELAHISSSLVRELQLHGKDVSEFIP